MAINLDIGMGVVAISVGTAGFGAALTAEYLMRATRRGEVDEKIAMMHSYSTDTCEKILSDLESLKSLAEESATPTQAKNIESAGRTLLSKMQTQYQCSSQQIDSAHKTLNDILKPHKRKI